MNSVILAIALMGAPEPVGAAEVTVKHACHGCKCGVGCRCHHCPFIHRWHRHHHHGHKHHHGHHHHGHKHHHGHHHK